MEPPSIEPLTGLLFIENFPILIAIIAMIVLLICSGLVSGSEVAFFSLTPANIDEINESKSNRGERVIQLLAKPKKLLATILIANNFINIAIILLSSFIIESLFAFDNEIIDFMVQVVAATFLILLVGEVIPKVFATKNNIQVAKLMALPLIITKGFFSPLVNMLVFSTSFIDKKIKRSSNNISVNDLEHALELSVNDNETSKEEKKILEGIVKFGNTDVKQIMKSRVDVVAFDNETPFKELLDDIIESGYSRLPIYDESFDNVVGILYAKDLIQYMNESDKFNWSKLTRKPLFVPENKKIDDLLQQFQESKVHMAIVVDEYGGTSGIVTLEDVIEEIIGDITDEFDDDDLVYTKIDEANYVFEGKTSLVDVYRVLEIDGENFEKEKGEADSLAGFLIEHSGKILRKNEKVNFERYTFTIEAADRRRIKQVKITINECEDEEE